MRDARSTEIAGESLEERAVLEEVLRALRGMRYGSILLTVHDGRLVEVQKTERIRKSKNTTAE